MKVNWKVSALLLLLSLSIQLSATVVARPSPDRFVNDLANLFSSNEVKRLEEQLSSFSDSTSNQITVVTVSSLEGYEIAQMAYSIGESWGVGGSKFNNGVVILIKPKVKGERGEAFIATGYGLEGALPDAFCKRIVELEMIPHFRENNYYKGVESALEQILPVAAGEYSYSQYRGEEGGAVAGVVVVLFFVLLFIFLARKSKKNPQLLNNIILMSAMSSGRRNRGVGGSGSMGGFKGGGFGGGRFGGGGAGGSW